LHFFYLSIAPVGAHLTLAAENLPAHYTAMHRAITPLVIGLFVIANTNCGDKKQASISWTMTIRDAGNDVLMDLTGATILFQEMPYKGEDQVELKVFDPNNKTGLERRSDTCSPGELERPSLGTSFSSGECEVRFGPHIINTRDKGHALEIDGTQFQINPLEKPGFVVASQDGQVSALKP
jgi:hypothetical protein